MSTTVPPRGLTSRQRRARRLVPLLALLLGAGTIGLALWGWPRLTDSPEKARRAYVDALVTADVPRLLGGATPQRGTVATKESLAAMRAAGGAVTAGEVIGDAAELTIAGERHRLTLPVAKVDGRLRVSMPLAEVKLAGLRAVAKVDGVTIVDSDVVRLTPGAHTLESGDPLLAFEPQRLLVVDPASPPAVQTAPVQLTDAAPDAIRRAIGESLRACLAVTGVAAQGCPNIVEDPDALLLQRETLTYRLAGDDPTARLEVALAHGMAWGTTAPVEIPLVVTGDALRRTDATIIRYEQPATVVARAFFSIANGQVSARWTE